MLEITWSFVSIFDDLLTGSSSTRPSRLPKMLWPTQLRISRWRCLNIGASTVFIRVSPVLPSLPVVHVLRCSHNSSAAGTDEPSDGVKLTYGKPRSSVAQAYCADAGARLG